MGLRLVDQLMRRNVMLPEGEFDLTIGRSSKCDITVPVFGEDEDEVKLPGIFVHQIRALRKLISSKHARLLRRDGSCYVVDCGSRNGTVVLRRDGSSYEVGEQPFELGNLDSISLAGRDRYPLFYIDDCAGVPIEDVRRYEKLLNVEQIGLDLRGRK